MEISGLVMCIGSGDGERAMCVGGPVLLPSQLVLPHLCLHCCDKMLGGLSQWETLVEEWVEGCWGTFWQQQFWESRSLPKWQCYSSYDRGSQTME